MTNKEVMCVVKSDCYGLGAKYIIKELVNNNFKYFFINNYHELISFKDLNTKCNILIMESIPLSLYQNSFHNLIYSINSYEDCLKIININQLVRVHLQVDIGMNRFGIKTIEELMQCLDVLKKYPNIIIEGLYAHLYKEIDKKNIKNITYFNKCSTLYNFKYVHLVSSKYLHLNVGNMVRVGMSLYTRLGISSKLNLVFTCYVKPLRVFTLKYQSNVGYGNVVKKSRRIGLFGFGYFECPDILYLVKRNQKYQKVGSFCMNHSYFYLDDKINEHTYLSLFRINDIINKEMNNIYPFIIGLKNLKKIYIKGYQRDLRKIIKKISCDGCKSWVRRRSNQNISTRTIRFKWS